MSAAVRITGQKKYSHICSEDGVGGKAFMVRKLCSVRPSGAELYKDQHLCLIAVIVQQESW